MGTKTLTNIRDRMAQSIGDGNMSQTVTTALTTNNTVTDTTLVKYTGNNDFFNRMWCLITSQNNDGENRKISDSTTTSLTVLGAAWASDGANKATYEIHTYNPDNYTRAINDAARELYGYLFRKIEWDDTLVTGNWLPDPHLEWWSSATALKWYTVDSNITLAKESGAANVRGGKYSAKATADSANGYFGTNSDIYPRLINVQGRTVSLFAWVNPQTADDAKVVIYTKTKAGTEATKASTTTNTAGNWTRISIEDHAIPEDLSKIEIRFLVTTSGQYAYFDKARLVGPMVLDLLAPENFQLGTITGYKQQITGNADRICDDVFTSSAHVVPYYGVTDYFQDGYKYIRLPYGPTFISYPYGSVFERKLILTGFAPLEDTLSSDSDTMTIDDPNTSLLVAYALYKLYMMESGKHSSEDNIRLKGEAFTWLAESERLKKTAKMIKPQSQTRLGNVSRYW